VAVRLLARSTACVVVVLVLVRSGTHLHTHTHTQGGTQMNISSAIKRA
jgi:hypothetical protein